MLKRIKRINSYVGFGRFLAECDDTPAGIIDRQTDIPSPYAYSPEWEVWRHGDKLVLVRETSHKQYDVFEVPASMVRTGASS